MERTKLKPLAIRIGTFATLCWAIWIYARYFSPTIQLASLLSAIDVRAVIIIGLALYAIVWYIFLGRYSHIGAGLRELPALLTLAYTVIIIASFGIALEGKYFSSYVSSNLAELAFFAAIIAAVYYVGDKVIELLCLDIDGLDRLFVSITAGFGICAVFVFIAGMAGAIYKEPARIAVATLAILGAVRAFSKFRGRFADTIKLSAAPSPLALIIVALLGFGFMAAWTPTWTYDALLYHIAVPKAYILAHQIHYIRDFLPANYPLNGEMLFMLGLLIKDDTVPQLLTYFIACWVVLGVFVFARRFFSYRTAVLAVMLLCTVSAFAYNITLNNNDTVLALFAFAGVYALVGWRETKNMMWLYVAGAFFGFAAGSKYSGFFMLVASGFLVVSLIVLSVGRGPSEAVRAALMAVGFALAAFIGVGPWLIKNYIYTGNPVYPTFMELFGGRDWNPAATTLFQSTIRSANQMTNNLPDDLAVLWHLTFRDIPQKTIGPAFVAFSACIPFALLRLRKAPAPLLLPVIVALGLLVPWTLLLAQTANYALPGIVILVPVIAAGIDTFIGNRLYLKLATAILLIAGVLASVNLLYATRGDAMAIGLAVRSHEEFLKGNMLYQAQNYINTYIPTDQRIAMVVDNRTYYLDKRPILMLSPLDNGRINQVGIRTPEQLMDILSREQVDYVFATDEIRRYTYSLPINSPFSMIYRPIVVATDGLVKQGGLQPVFRYHDFWLYKVAKQNSTQSNERARKRQPVPPNRGTGVKP
jgi:hypothetical protein